MAECIFLMVFHFVAGGLFWGNCKTGLIVCLIGFLLAAAALVYRIVLWSGGYFE